MAMIRMATRSSTTAIVDSSSFIPNGTREPSNARMPSAKAISVAVGMAQPRSAMAIALVHDPVQNRRHRHAADRAQHRQQHLFAAGELAAERLALDFQRHQQEEHRHQPVVDPVFGALHQPEIADAETDRQVPERLVRALPRRVGHDHRQCGSGHQHDAGGGLQAEEIAQQRDAARNGIDSAHASSISAWPRAALSWRSETVPAPPSPGRRRTGSRPRSC